MSPPVGPTGCEGPSGGSDHGVARPWLASVGYGRFDSELAFDDFDADIEQQGISLAVGYQFDDALSARVAVGLILGGELEPPGFEIELGTGVSISIAAAYRVTRGKLFATGTGSFGVGRTGVELGADSGSMVATDARLGALGGVTLWNRVSPYVLARVFAGPVFLSLGDMDQTGSDTSKHQLGGGVSAALPGNFALQIEASVVGEKTLSGGVAMLF